MDPNANLDEQERILQALADIDTVLDVTHARTSDTERLRSRLFELRVALANWLHDGGFAPDWSRAPMCLAFYRDYIVHKAVHRLTGVGYSGRIPPVADAIDAFE